MFVGLGIFSENLFTTINYQDKKRERSNRLFQKSYNYYNFRIIKRVNINEVKQRTIFNIISEMGKKYIQHSCGHRQLYGCYEFAH